MMAETSNQQAQSFLRIHKQLGTQQAIKNIESNIGSIKVGQSWVPLSVNKTEYRNSYVCSPYTAYISYAKDELGLIQNRFQRAVLRAGIFVGSGLLKAARINQTTSINNWLFSTNLLPDWQVGEIEQSKQELIKEYPEHSVSIRSLNQQHHASLIESLRDLGWQLIPARQVYLFNDEYPENWWKRSHTKKDQSLLRKVEAGKLPLVWVKPEELIESDFVDIADSFQKLFIDKHSQHNPQFSAEYLKALHQDHLVEFHSFRNQQGRIVASIGLFTQHNIITTPIVGYDTSLPKELGLYRLLMAVLLRLTYERQQPMNLSSGAGSFKRVRGGESVLEYTAFFTQHLNTKRKFAHGIFARIMNRFAPRIFLENQI
jgi:hypothetical protein